MVGTCASIPLQSRRLVLPGILACYYMVPQISSSSSENLLTKGANAPIVEFN